MKEEQRRIGSKRLEGKKGRRKKVEKAGRNDDAETFEGGTKSENGKRKKEKSREKESRKARRKIEGKKEERKDGRRKKFLTEKEGERKTNPRERKNERKWQ